MRWAPQRTLWDKSVLPLLLSDAEMARASVHELQWGPNIPGVLQPGHDFEIIASDASGYAGGAWWRHERSHYTAIHHNN